MFVFFEKVNYCNQEKKHTVELKTSIRSPQLVMTPLIDLEHPIPQENI